MAKDAMITGRISKELKDKAKEHNITVSDALEKALIVRAKDTTISTLIITVERYGVSLMPNNFVVGRLSDAFLNPIEGDQTKIREFFDTSTITYHPSLHQALIRVSKRLFEDKLKIVCKDKPLELIELSRLIKEHHAYIVGIVEGM